MSKKRKQTFEQDPEPPSKKQKSEESYVKWKIFSDDQEYTLKIFKGIPLNDVKQNISDITGIDQFICKDEDNDMLALSSYLPNNTKIYIQRKSDSQSVENVVVRERSESEEVLVEDTQKYIVTVRDPRGIESDMLIRVNQSCPMSRVINAYCSQINRREAEMRFVYDGMRIWPHMTVDQLDLEENDNIIYAMLIQKGS